MVERRLIQAPQVPKDAGKGAKTRKVAIANQASSCLMNKWKVAREGERG